MASDWAPELFQVSTSLLKTFRSFELKKRSRTRVLWHERVSMDAQDTKKQQYRTVCCPLLSLSSVSPSDLNVRSVSFASRRPSKRVEDVGVKCDKL